MGKLIGTRALSVGNKTNLLLWLGLLVLVAGLVSAFAAVIAQKYLAPLNPDSARSSENLTGWLVVAIACTIMTLALWRFWPEPRARLW